MRYALLLSYKESSPEAPPEDTLAPLDRFVEQARAQLVSVLRLLPTWSATCVRVRDGGLVIEDGPFAETEEQIGGLLVVDCADLDEAIELASRVPVAPTGTVENRPASEPWGTRPPRSRGCIGPSGPASSGCRGPGRRS